MQDLRQWLFRAMMFEADAERFRSAGIRVGADQGEIEASLLEESLRPFSVELRNDALAMTMRCSIVSRIQFGSS